MREKGKVAAKDVLRHAVDAAEIASVGDRDSQVVQVPAEHVDRKANSVVGGERGLAQERV